RVQFVADRAGDVLGGQAARDPVLAQGARPPYEFAGRAPQRTGQGGEFGMGGGGGPAFPGGDERGGDVRQSVRAAQGVGDVLGAHAQGGPQPAGGGGGERRGRMAVGTRGGMVHGPQARPARKG